MKQQMIERVVDTLKDNAKAVVMCAVDESGIARVYIKGTDEEISMMIGKVQEAFLEDIASDVGWLQELLDDLEGLDAEDN